MASTLGLVALGGAIGAALRWLASQGALRLDAPLWQATLGVNVVGGLAMGALAGLALDPASPWRAFLGVGVLGGFTTFSAFSLETVAMLERREIGLAFAYMAGSTLAAISACWMGLMIARSAA